VEMFPLRLSDSLGLRSKRWKAWSGTPQTESTCPLKHNNSSNDLLGERGAIPRF
jgi:hypothetical protein